MQGAANSEWSVLCSGEKLEEHGCIFICSITRDRIVYPHQPTSSLTSFCPSARAPRV